MECLVILCFCQHLDFSIGFATKISNFALPPLLRFLSNSLILQEVCFLHVQFSQYIKFYQYIKYIQEMSNISNIYSLLGIFCLGTQAGEARGTAGRELGAGHYDIE